jgi:hypothetical protein
MSDYRGMLNIASTELDDRTLTAGSAMAAAMWQPSTGLRRERVSPLPVLGKFPSQLSCRRPITSCFRGGPSWASPKQAAPLFLLTEDGLREAGDGRALFTLGDNNACESFPRSRAFSCGSMLCESEAALLGELLVDNDLRKGGLLTSRSPRMRRGESVAAIETSSKRISNDFFSKRESLMSRL